MTNTGAVVASVPVSCEWEYRIISIHARQKEVLQEALNELGSEKWELMTIYEPLPNDWCCVFKRPKS